MVWMMSCRLRSRHHLWQGGVTIASTLDTPLRRTSRYADEHCLLRQSEVRVGQSRDTRDTPVQLYGGLTRAGEGEGRTLNWTGQYMLIAIYYIIVVHYL